MKKTGDTLPCLGEYYGQAAHHSFYFVELDVPVTILLSIPLITRSVHKDHQFPLHIWEEVQAAGRKTIRPMT